MCIVESAFGGFGFGGFFLGEVEERRGNFAAARASYEQAAALFPLAQKPQLALSQLSWREDAQEDAWESLQLLLSRQTPNAADDPFTPMHERRTGMARSSSWSGRPASRRSPRPG